MNTVLLSEASVVFNDDDSYERIRREQEYLEYIIEHINFVKKAYVMYFVPLLDKSGISSKISDEQLKDAIEELALTIETHDASKFSDSEFNGYRAKYYPTRKEESVDDGEYRKLLDDMYDECWKHHYETNDHHAKHWVDPETNIPRDMSLRAIVEMICDWEAMSMKFNSSTLTWYENDAKDEKECLSPKTKEIVEELLYNVLHK